MTRFGSLLERRPRNATVAWPLVGLIALWSVATLIAGDLVPVAYGVAVVAVAIAPAVVARDASVIVAWPVLGFAVLPILARWAGVAQQPTAYASLAALALLVAVEVEAFSSAEMPPWFAVTFVVMTTMTVAALWGVVQYLADLALGTTFLADRTELMWDLVAATVVGLVAGLVFELFFRVTERPQAGVEGPAN